MTIGERIKELRKKRNMTQEELAFKVGYKSRSSINKIEIGERDITQSMIIKFANALGTTPSYIMGWDRHLDLFTNIGELLYPGNKDTELCPQISEIDEKAFDIYLSLDDVSKAAVRNYIDYEYMQTQKRKEAADGSKNTASDE